MSGVLFLASMGNYWWAMHGIAHLHAIWRRDFQAHCFHNLSCTRQWPATQQMFMILLDGDHGDVARLQHHKTQ